MFIWSGGNPRVSQAIRGSDLRQIADQGGKGFYRSNNRESPHNLYNSTDAIYALAPLDATAPPPQFEYRDAGGSITGDDVEGVKISMDGVRVLWKWDINLAVFLRSSDDKPHIDANDGAQLNTQNVVVLFVKYVASAADRSSPEAQTIGSGSVTVLSGGKAVQGRWTRADRLNPFTLTDANGSPILLSPGRTYVELARADTAAIIPANVDPGTIRYP